MPITVAYALSAGNVVLTLTETAFGNVDGASNLDTAGYVPYVSAAGVLSIVKTAAKQLFFDAANGRFGIGTITPISPLHVFGSIVCAGATSTALGRIQFSPGTASATAWVGWYLPNGTRLGYMGDSATNVPLNLENGAKFVISGGPLVTPTATPASAAATGVAGQWAWDATYIYMCVATNTWKRALIETW